MGKHAGHHQAPDRTQPNKASSQTSSSSSSTSSLLAKSLLCPGGARRSSTVVTPQPAKPSASASESQNSVTTTPIQPQAHDPKPARARVPAVTSKAMTTAPEKDKSRPHRRKYPTKVFF